MNLSDAFHSERIFWHPKFEEDPTISNMPLFYEVILRNASPHSQIFIDVWKPRKKTRLSDLFNDFRQQIIELQNLSKGWDSYNADPPNYNAIIIAIKILDILFESQFIPSRIMPSVEGGVSFLFTRNIKYADIECDNDGDIFAGMSDRIGEPILWQITEGVEEKSLSASIFKIRSFLET